MLWRAPGPKSHKRTDRARAIVPLLFNPPPAIAGSEWHWFRDRGRYVLHAVGATLLAHGNFFSWYRPVSLAATTARLLRPLPQYITLVWPSMTGGRLDPLGRKP